MIVKEYFYNIECDCCKELVSEDWWSDKQSIREAAFEADFMKMANNKMYCPTCRSINSDGNIATKDGCIYDGDTHELLSKNK
jgi:Zn finger protein HypA/HybF involved in hydrogenase expression